MTKLPASQRAEESVLGGIFRQPKLAGEIVDALLEPRHFYFAPYRLAFEQIVEAYYSDDPIDALTIAERISKSTAKMWDVDERDAVDRVTALASALLGDEVSIHDHAKVIKRHSDFRELATLAQTITQAVEREELDPDQIAGEVSQSAMQIATNTVLHDQVYSYGDLGRRFVERMKLQMAAREAGVELGAYFGIPAIDNFLKGLRPSELLMGAGEPGTGKSALFWVAAERFARRQMKKPEDRRIGSLILSLEMGEEPSSGRLAQSVSHLDGGRIREATLSRAELMNAARSWAGEKDLPLYVGHQSALTQSQLRAVCVEQIRKHHVGLVIIDNFKFLNTDRFMPNPNDRDEELVKFLKNTIAKDLNLAVICIAHTVKSIERSDRRPGMNELRGSGAVQAFADFICFVYRPWLHASEKDRLSGNVNRTDAELIWAKSRHSASGTGDFYLDISKMQVS